MTDTEILEAARALPSEQLPAFIGLLAQATAEANARLLRPAPALPDDSKLLNIAEASQVIGCSVHWLRRHPELPCIRRIGKKVLFHSSELQKYIKQKR